MLYTQKDKLDKVAINIDDLLSYKDTMLTLDGRCFPVYVWKVNPQKDWIKNKRVNIYTVQCKEFDENGEYHFSEIYLDEKQQRIVGISLY